MKYSILICTVLLLACSANENSKYVETNLIEHGIPLTILAPDSLKVSKSNIGFQEDITLKGGEGYDVQLFVSESTAGSKAKAVADQKETVESIPFFSEIVRSDENGFVYKNQIDSSLTTYGFKYVHLMGGKEYVFSQSLMGSFTLDEVEEMYKCISQKK